MPHNSGIKKSLSTRSGKKSSRARAAASPSLQKTDARLGRIIQVMTGNATVVMSGTKLAQEIGTNRSEVWRLIQQLRRLGVDVAGHPATGYQLRAVPDLLLPDVLNPLLKGTIFSKQVQHYYRIGSTNSAAMEAAAAGAPEGSVFLAEEQTAGRGRGARNWLSARSAGIYCSLVLRPSLPPSEALVLSLAVGLAAREAILSIDPHLNPDLKWPNDLLLQGKKFCGILTEMNAEATRVRYIVVGVGINVNQSAFPPELREEATSLRLVTGTEWSRVELTAALLKSLHREYRNFMQKPNAHESILRRFAEHSSYARGRQVRVEENGGFEGVTEGLDQRGFLQVRTPQGLRLVLSGTIRAR
ncbi:MAG: biotin--[acetyl-CoA-carboxylase] ligase [Acidobacteria bacterium]|nr:MAG: biotin--[acetyl-CoA-carboxylase] ligase [Acidobacteriota bacterium]